MGLCFTTILVLSLVAKNIEDSFSSWGNKVEMSVYLSEDLEEEGRSRVEKALSTMKEVKSFHYLDKEKAKDLFYESFSEMVPELDEFADENPFLASFEVSLAEIPASVFSVKYLENFKEKLEKLDGIEEVGYGKYWFESYAGIMRGINSSVLIVAIILSLASLLIVGNSIRAQVYRRKKEVEILELIGATSQWIRAPFVVGGVLTGAIASLMAIGGSIFIYGLVVSKFSAAIRSLGIQDRISFFGIMDIVLIVVAGALVGGIGSYMCIRGINTGWSAIKVVEE
jgi:cell division transport system permease protein